MVDDKRYNRFYCLYRNVTREEIYFADTFQFVKMIKSKTNLRTNFLNVMKIYKIGLVFYIAKLTNVAVVMYSSIHEIVSFVKYKKLNLHKTNRRTGIC